MCSSVNGWLQYTFRSIDFHSYAYECRRQEMQGDAFFARVSVCVCVCVWERETKLRWAVRFTLEFTVRQIQLHCASIQMNWKIKW